MTQAVIGTSVGGSPITALVMGKGMEGALVIAGIRGNEPAAVILARQMVEQLKGSASFSENRQIVIIPEVNPDAVLKNSRFNQSAVKGIDRLTVVNISGRGRRYPYEEGAPKDAFLVFPYQVSLTFRIRLCR